MADPVLDAINQPAGKKWWQSRTIWGLIITTVSIAAPKYGPLAEALPAGVDLVAAFVGLALGAYGRIKTDKPITR